MIGSSNVGGFFGFRIHTLDIHSLIVTGRSATPVYLYIGPDGVEVKDARHLWGLDNRDAEERLGQEIGMDNIDLLTIGPAGEKKSRMPALWPVGIMRPVEQDWARSWKTRTSKPLS